MQKRTEQKEPKSYDILHVEGNIGRQATTNEYKSSRNICASILAPVFEAQLDNLSTWRRSVENRCSVIF